MSSKCTIAKIETFRVPPRWLFVRVETNDGIVGWGESTLEGHTEAVEGAFSDLRRFIGVEADNIVDIWQEAYMGRFYRGGPVLMSALSGLDIALWDIKGKRHGIPVWKLLGGKIRDRIKVYGWIGGDQPSDVLDAAKNRKAEGFTCVKMNATDIVARIDSPEVLRGTVERVRQVQSVGLDVGIDFHGRLHKGMAKQLAKLLEPLHPLFIEEPLLPTQPEEIADISHLVSTPIALGERLYTRFDFRPYLERRVIDIAQPDVSHCGGITELHRIASLTETYDVTLAPHCPLGPIALAACMQVATSAPNCGFLLKLSQILSLMLQMMAPFRSVGIQEMSWKMHYNITTENDPGSEADLHTYMSNPEVFAVKDGHINVLEGPGIGVVIDEQRVREAAQKHVEDQSLWRNPVWRGVDGSLTEW
ncbi:enolase C-terminal domain-like protein [Dendrothele bispora CBS 962.96]|uniref:Enolase C-terminal domain-like protein n=1 Tax=Dendrothele bispora (strain CBS 962.96) TaxID=1314807 RepID=A0A4S8MPF9_DENBC|nr:enolase C-terminal domain-like protein [Dendrothele bispora CBS 962.96]